MKLTYWVCPRKHDSQAYALRARTKKEALALLSEHSSEDYDSPQKVVVEYKDGFDLLQKCLGEGQPEWDLKISDEAEESQGD